MSLEKKEFYTEKLLGKTDFGFFKQPGTNSKLIKMKKLKLFENPEDAGKKK